MTYVIRSREREKNKSAADSLGCSDDPQLAVVDWLALPHVPSREITLREKVDSDIVESIQKVSRVDFPLSADVRAMILIYGEPGREEFARLRDAISLWELAVLGPDPNRKPIVLPGKGTKTILTGRKHPGPDGDGWIDRVCSLHPDAPRNRANGCTRCLSERKRERHASAFSASSGHVEVGCSKRHFQRLVPDVLGKDHARWALYTAEEIQKIREYWLLNRSAYELEAAANLEDELDELVENNV